MAPPPCVLCNKTETKFCSSCNSISYCSQTCQKPDWPLHKKVCKSFAALPPRPSPSHKLAILFPVDSKDPQLIWIKCERHVYEQDGIVYEMPETQPLLGVENLNPVFRDAREEKPITYNLPRGISLGYTVKVIGRETFLMDGSSPNVCIRHTTKGRMAHDWRGPLVVMRQPGTNIDPLVYEDITAADLRVAVDYFLSYGKEL